MLDAKIPDWRTRIDTRTLNLADCSLCVIGQLFGMEIKSFLTGVTELDIYRNGKDAYDLTYNYGFSDWSDDDYRILTEEWRKVLTPAPVAIPTHTEELIPELV